MLKRAAKAEEPRAVTQLRERIAELEQENALIRQLEETTRRNTHLFERVLANSRDGIALMTPAMTVLRLIRGAAGYEEADLLGQSPLSITHPDDVSNMKTSFDRLLAGDARTESCEFRVRTKDGHWAWIDLAMTDMLDDPCVQAIVFNYRNITERKYYAEKAQVLEAYRSCAACALFSETRAGSILDWNALAETAFGYAADEIVGRNVSILIPDDLLESELAVHDQIFQGDPVPEYQTARVRKDGERVPVVLKVAPVRDSLGRVYAIANIAHLKD